MAKMKMKRLYTYLGESNFVWQSYAKHLIAIKVVEKMSPEGFDNGKKYLFAQLIFNNSKAMKSFRYKFEADKMKIYLDKKNSEFISSGVFLPEQLRRGGANMDTHTFKFNQGKCEILDK